MAFKGTSFNPDKFHKSQIKFHLYLIPISLFMMLPILFVINNAFKPFTELFAYPPKFFVRKPTLENFRMLFNFSVESGIPMTRFLFNSIIVSGAVVVLSVLLSLMTAYSMSKLKFKGQEQIFKINTMALMFVPVAVAIPRYLIVVYGGIYNTMLAHILPLLAMPIGLFLVKQFVDQIPNELLEAARVDGASNWYIFWKIVFPLVTPAIVTVAFLAFQTSWGNLQSSTNFIENEALKTLPFYLNTLVDSSGNIVASAGMNAAAQLLMFIPNFVLFIFLQSKIMESMSHSGIK